MAAAAGEVARRKSMLNAQTAENRSMRKKDSFESDVGGSKTMSLSQLKKMGDENKRAQFLEKQTNLNGIHKDITYFCSNLTGSSWFQQFIVALILISGGLAGASTYSKMQEGQTQTNLEALDNTVLYIFTLEIVIKVLAMGRQPLEFFKDGWNFFDFFIVVLCYVSEVGLGFNPSFIRIIRLLRVLKLLNALPELQILVVCLIKSFKSMIYILLLLFLLFYLYGVMACFVFQDNDPMHFGSLESSFLSLYRISTFEDWTDIMYINIYGCDRYYYQGTDKTPPGPRDYDGGQGPRWHTCDKRDSVAFGPLAAVYFVSFTLLATFIVFNLFVGVILTNIESARTETMEEIRSLALGDEDYNRNKEKYRKGRASAGKVVADATSCIELAAEIRRWQGFLHHKRTNGFVSRLDVRQD